MADLSQSKRPEKLRFYPKQIIFYITQNKNILFPDVEKNLTCDGFIMDLHSFTQKSTSNLFPHLEYFLS